MRTTRPVIAAAVGLGLGGGGAGGLIGQESDSAARIHVSEARTSVGASGLAASSVNGVAVGAERSGAWDAEQSAFPGIGLTIESFAGRQMFDVGLSLDDQAVAGVRAGFDAGPFLALRGFWWRGVTEGLDDWEGIQGYGGEAQLILGGLTELSPHLAVGGGRMEFATDYQGGEADILAGRNALIVGGGVDLRIGGRVSLSAAARDYIVTGLELEDDASSGSREAEDSRLAHNWQVSAGLKLLLGRRPEARGSRAGTTRRGEVVVTSVAGGVTAEDDRGRGGEIPSAEQEVVRGSGGGERRAATVPGASPSIIVIPIAIPLYGLPGWVPDTLATAATEVMTPADFRDLLRAELADAPPPPAPGVSQADLEAAESRLAKLLESGLDDMRRRLEETARAIDANEDAVAIPAADTVSAGPGAGVASPSGLDPSLGFPYAELRPYTAVQIGRDAQWVYGIAWDQGPGDVLAAFNFVPEVALGIGEGKPSWMASANMQYRIPWLFERDSFWISPVASIGLGLLNQDGNDIVLNVSYGAHMQLRRDGGDGNPVNIYVAHQGVDLFGRDRMILGLSLER